MSELATPSIEKTDPTTMLRVLVADGHVRHMLSVVRNITDHFEVSVASHCKFSICSASRFCGQHFVLPANRNTADALIDLCQQHSFDFIVCSLEATLIGLSRRYQDLLDTGVVPVFPDFDSLDLALDKSRTLQFADQAEVPFPCSIVVNSNEEIPAAAKKIGFPIVIKPRRLISIGENQVWTNRGPMYASDAEQLRGLIAEMPKHLEPPIVQEFIPGECVSGFFLIDRQGECVAEFAHERIRDVNPTGSGSSFRKSVPIDPEVRQHSLNLLRAMNWRGVAMVEYRRSSADGSIHLMEVNGRLWGSLDLAVRSGVNFPLMMIECCRDDSTEVIRQKDGHNSDYKNGLHLRWLLGDMLRFLRIMRGAPTGYPGKFPSRWQGLKELLDIRNLTCKYEVLRFSDPLPFIAEAVSVFRKKPPE